MNTGELCSIFFIKKTETIYEPAAATCAEHRIHDECVCVLANLYICVYMSSFIHIRGLDNEAEYFSCQYYM